MKVLDCRAQRYARLTLFSLLMYGYSSSVWASPSCTELTGCERKQCEIEVQIDRAQQQGNKKKEQGLTKALRAVHQSCTPEQLAEQLREAIEEKQEKIKDYQNDQREAGREGKAKKVEKYQKKAEQQQAELDRLQQELSELLAQ